MKPNKKTQAADEKRLVLGKVLTTFGVKGYVKVVPLADYPERLEEVDRFFGRLADGSEIELHPEDVEVRKMDLVLVKFREFDTPEAASLLRNASLEIPRSEARPLEPGHYYYADVVGLEVRLPDETVVGTVVDVLEAGNVILSIRTSEGKDLWVPWVDEFVCIDLPAGVVHLSPIEGLLD